MNTKKVEQLYAIQKIAIGQILTFAEIGLPPSQFKPFKKLVMNLLHEELKPQILRILKDKDQVRAVPDNDNFDKKGG